MRRILSLPAVLLSTLLPAGAAPPGPPPAKLSDVPLTSLSGEPFPHDQIEGKPVLFVNVASHCGHTPQYDGLQSLYEKYRARGLVIVGVPCNQFGAQEPGSPDEIASFCKMNYGVEFPLLEKQDVNGPERSPLYQYLLASQPEGQNIKWNFEKFLVGRDGKVVGHFSARTKPEDPSVVSAIEANL